MSDGREWTAAEPSNPTLMEPAHDSRRAVRLAFSLALLALAYVAGAIVATSLRFPSSHLSLLWPPTAIVLSALLLTPTRRWWLIVLALTPVHVAIQFIDGVPALGIASQLLGNFGQALLAAMWIRVLDPGAVKFDSLRRIAVFAGAALVAPALASSLIANLYVLSGWEQDYWYVARARFLSNVLSTLTIVPPIVLAMSGGIVRAGRAPFWRLVESASLAACLVVVGSFAFGELGADSGHRLALLYAPLPPLLWASVRFGVGGLCLSLLLTAFMAFLGAGEIQGPFFGISPAEDALAVQVFLIVVALPLLALAGLVEERRQDQQSLRDSQRRYRLASAAGNVGLWDWNLTTGEIYIDPSLKAMLGFEDHEIPNRIEDWARRIHPEDLDRVMAEAQAHIRGLAEACEIEHRMICKDGGVRWFLARGSIIERADGSAVRMVGTDTDITDRRLADAALHRSDARYRAIVEDQTELICRFFPGGTYTFVNGAYCRYFQRSPQELIGQDFWQFIPAEYREAGVRHLQSITPDRPVATIEHEVLAPGGEKRWQQWTNRGFFDSAGRIIEYQAVGRDITERKRAEEALRKNEERLAIAIEAAQLGLWDWDLTTGAAAWSDQMRRLYGREGVSPGAPLESFMEMVHPDDRERVRQAIDESIQRPVPYEAEYRVVLPDGTVRWILAKGRTFYDAKGKPVRRAGANRDITERKQAEEEHRLLEAQRQVEAALRQSEERFRTLADSAPVLIWMSGLNNEAIYFNRPWLEFTGRQLDEELGFGWVESMHPEDRQRCVEMCNAAFAAREPIAMQFRLRRHDGEYRWVLDNGLPHFGADGAFIGYVGSCVDITERQRAEEALQEAGRRKDEFLAMLGHELRNPLAPIGMAVEIIRIRGPADDTVAWARDVISRQLAQLTRLVDDLLDVSRITRGKIKLDMARIDLGRVIAQAVETSQPLISARNHHLSIDVPNIPLPIQGDRVRLAQVVSNLLSNAAKYTDTGGRIRLTLQLVGSQAVLAIADNGVGIPPDMLDRVFDMFTQVVDHADRSQGGLGIGLTLVKRLVELHGGAIEARSDGPGSGSEFIVRLPLAIGLPADAAPDEGSGSHDDSFAVEHETEPRRILVVDDNVDAAESLSRMLRIQKHEVGVAHDGVAALKAAEHLKPDIVLLDIGLPKLDGLEVARRLRHRAGSPRPLLVATTGFGQAEDRRRIVEAGFDHHLIKPIDPRALQAIVRTGKPGTASVPTTRALKSRHDVRRDLL